MRTWKALRMDGREIATVKAEDVRDARDLIAETLKGSTLAEWNRDGRITANHDSKGWAIYAD